MRYIFIQEMKKIWIKKYGVLMLFLALLLEVYLLWSDRGGIQINQIRYKHYMSEIEGPYSEEKSQKIQAWCEYNNNILLQKDDVMEEYAQSIISLDEYHLYMDRYNLALIDRDVLEYVNERREYLDRHASTEAIYYEIDWKYYFDSHSFDYPILMLLLFLFVPFFDMEFQKERNNMIVSLKYGKRTFAITKGLVALTTILVMSSTIYFAKWLSLSSICNSDLASAPICTMTGYAAFHGLSIREFFAYQSLWRILVWCIAVMALPTGIYVFKSFIAGIFYLGVFVYLATLINEKGYILAIYPMISLNKNIEYSIGYPAMGLCILSFVSLLQVWLWERS